MKIEKIKKMKNGKYKIELENKETIITYDDVILNNNLLFNNEVDNCLINKLNIDTAYYNVYNRVIKYIVTKMRSLVEITIYLDKLGVNEIDKNKIINSLKEIGLINDLSFAKAFISDKINLSNIGPNQIKRDLIGHNIEETVIDEILNNYEEEVFINKINRLIEKKIRTNKNSNYVLKQKIINDLINLGYDSSMIISCLDQTVIKDNNAIIKDYKKIYNKLSTSLSGTELLYKVKNKLYQKGYKIDEINEVIKKDS